MACAPSHILGGNNDDGVKGSWCQWRIPLIWPASCCTCLNVSHDDVIKWKHFPRHWHFVRGIHRSPVNSPQKGQWRGALMFSLICVWINDWVNNREAGDLRRNQAHYDVIVMSQVGGGSGRMPGAERWLQWFKSYLPDRNGRHFADDILICIFVNEKFVFWLKFHWSFVPKGPIDNNLALV